MQITLEMYILNLKKYGLLSKPDFYEVLYVNAHQNCWIVFILALVTPVLNVLSLSSN
jgi:hypothetical protein